MDNVKMTSEELNELEEKFTSNMDEVKDVIISSGNTFSDLMDITTTELISEVCSISTYDDYSTNTHEEFINKMKYYGNAYKQFEYMRNISFEIAKTCDESFDMMIDLIAKYEALLADSDKSNEVSDQ